MSSSTFKDPTKDEMLTYLKQTFHHLMNTESNEEFGIDAEIAIYWYAHDYHTGQNSELYRVLSASDYSPNCKSYETENESVHLLYESLEDEFGKEYICPNCDTLLESEVKEITGKTLIYVHKCHNCNYEEEI